MRGDRGNLKLRIALFSADYRVMFIKNRGNKNGQIRNKKSVQAIQTTYGGI